MKWISPCKFYELVMTRREQIIKRVKSLQPPHASPWSCIHYDQGKRKHERSRHHWVCQPASSSLAKPIASNNGNSHEKGWKRKIQKQSIHSFKIAAIHPAKNKDPRPGQQERKNGIVCCHYGKGRGLKRRGLDYRNDREKFPTKNTQFSTRIFSNFERDFYQGQNEFSTQNRREKLYQQL